MDQRGGSSPIRTKGSVSGSGLRPTTRGTLQSGGSRSRKHFGPQSELDGLQEQSEAYTKRIEMEKRRADELEKKLAVSRRLERIGCAVATARLADFEAQDRGHSAACQRV
jgi:hypothetical protein